MRKIIILERVNEPSDFNFKVAFWLTVQAQRKPYEVNADAVSAVKDATAQELQEIKDGAVREVVFVASYPDGTTAAAIKTDLVNRYNAAQAELHSRNPWKYYGTFWNGTGWTNAGVN